MLPALGVRVFVLESVCAIGWERGVVAPVAHLSFGSIVPHHARYLVFMGRTMGVGPGRWVKQFNTCLLYSVDACREGNYWKMNMLGSHWSMNLLCHSDSDCFWWVMVHAVAAQTPY